MRRAWAAILPIFAACATAPVDVKPIDALMRDYDGPVPGASVMVIRQGRVVLVKSYGLADVEDHVAATPKTNYRLASVTKQFTATGIEILADRGRLGYDDRITRYLTLPAYANGITILHLLTHTSGLLDYEDLIPPGTTEQLHDGDVLHLLQQQDHTMFPPGSRYRYSNSGYALLALIVEKVSGQSFSAFLKHEIFDPLGMKATVAWEKGISTVANRAFGYSRREGDFVCTDQSLTSAVLGDGGIYSSIDDLFRWDQALEHARLVKAETLRVAFSPAVPTDDPGVHYGFGWRVSEHDGRRMLWHSGETMGFRNVILRFPDDRLTVIVLTNRNDPPPNRVALAIADHFVQPSAPKIVP